MDTWNTMLKICSDFLLSTENESKSLAWYSKYPCQAQTGPFNQQLYLSVYQAFNILEAEAFVMIEDNDGS